MLGCETWSSAITVVPHPLKQTSKQTNPLKKSKKNVEKRQAIWGSSPTKAAFWDLFSEINFLL